MNQEQLNGRLAFAQGKVREVVGTLIGNKPLQRRGVLQQKLGHAQAVHGDFRNYILHMR